MKTRALSIYFLFFLCIGASSSFAQRVKYEVKVVLHHAENVKGTLQRVSAEGISVTDYRGKNHFLTPQHINKIKVRRKGLNFVESVATGTGIGLVGGATIILLSHSESDLAVAFGVALVVIGAAGGALGGLIGEALNTELILILNKDTEKFKNEFLKLEKYSKSFNLDK
jgi:hypothetical protein